MATQNGVADPQEGERSQSDKKKFSRLSKLLFNRNWPPYFTYVKRKLTSVQSLEQLLPKSFSPNRYWKEKLTISSLLFFWVATSQNFEANKKKSETTQKQTLVPECCVPVELVSLTLPLYPFLFPHHILPLIRQHSYYILKSISPAFNLGSMLSYP